MGYSTSRETIERVQPILEILLATDPNKEVSFPAKDTRKLVYAIRDAFHSCEHFKTDYGKFLVIKDRYRILQKDGKVIFSPRKGLEVGDPVIELRAAYENKSELTFDKLTTHLEILGAIIEHKPNKAIFTNAKLSHIELSKIGGWAFKHGYIISESVPLTIEKHESSK